MNVAKGDLLLVLGREMDEGRREGREVVTIGRAQQHRDVRVGQRDEREGRRVTFEVRGRKTRSEAPRRLVVALRVLSSIVLHPFAGTGKAWVRQLDHDLHRWTPAVAELLPHTGLLGL